MANIFVSYNRESQPVVETLAEDIEAIGHTVWFDHALVGGQAWWDQILSRIRDCAVFVFVLDPVALNSTACKREYGYAADLGKPILPVLVSDGVSLNLLPPALSKIEYVEYREQDRKAAFRLARALASVPPPLPLPDPLPAEPQAPISYLGSLTEKVDTSSTLDREEQSALLVDLKRSLRDPKTTDDGRTLLNRFRRRHDLLATIAEEIDEVLASKQGMPPAPPPDVEMTPSHLSQPPQGRPLPTPREESQAEKPGTQRWAGQLVWTTSDHIPTGKERLKAAGIGGVAGAGMGLIMNSPVLTLIGASIGSLSGLISGMNRTRIVAALIGLVVVVILSVFFGVLRYFPADAPYLAPPAVGAAVGAMIERLRRKGP